MSPRRTLLRRGLGSRPTRAALTVAGVALSTLLVLVLLAARRNLTEAVDRYCAAGPVDLWLTPRGSDNLVRSTGTLPWEVSEAALEVPGVLAADPILRSFVTVEGRQHPGAPHGRVTLLGVGYRLPDGLGGPPGIAEGRPPSRWDEVAVDRAAAHRLGVRVGEPLQVAGLEVRVTGLTSGTNLFATQFLFGDLGSACRAAGLAGRVSFVAVRVVRSEDPVAVAQRIRAALPAVTVLSRQDFAAANRREVAAGLLPLLALIVVLGLAVAAALVALLAQGLVEERRAEVAVLLALGASPTALTRALLSHLARLVTAGGVTGGALTFLFASATDRFLPTVELAIRWHDLLPVAAAFLSAALLAGTAPVARLRGVEPLEAFRS
jgi:putative ABC transport system permease protein